LNPETHSSLRILTDHADIEDIRRFLEQAGKLERQGDRDNIDAVLQASVAANFGLYEKTRRDSVMCQAMRELMKDEIAKEIATERIDAANKAADKAETETQINNIRNIMSELKYTAEQAMDLLKIPQQKRSLYISKL
jgi:hypothetical protein